MAGYAASVCLKCESNGQSDTVVINAVQNAQSAHTCYSQTVGVNGGATNPEILDQPYSSTLPP